MAEQGGRGVDGDGDSDRVSAVEVDVPGSAADKPQPFLWSSGRKAPWGPWLLERERRREPWCVGDVLIL